MKNTISILKQLLFFLIISFSISAAAYEELEEIWNAHIAEVNETLKLNSKNAEAHFNKAFALAQLSRHKEAIASFDLAIKYKFKHLGLLYYTKGNSLRALNMLEEALVCYNKAIKLGFADRELHVAREDVLMKLGRLGKGLDPI